MIKSIDVKLKRWGEWSNLRDRQSVSSGGNALHAVAQRKKQGISYGDTQSDETKRSGIDIKHKVVDCPGCGYFPLRVGNKCPKCPDRTIRVHDHTHNLNKPRDDSGKIASNISINSDPVAEQIEELLCELKKNHDRVIFKSIEQKYRYCETNDLAAKRLAINIDTYKNYINYAHYWLEGRLRSMSETS